MIECGGRERDEELRREKIVVQVRQLLQAHRMRLKSFLLHSEHTLFTQKSEHDENVGVNKRNGNVGTKH